MPTDWMCICCKSPLQTETRALCESGDSRKTGAETALLSSLSRLPRIPVSFEACVLLPPVFGDG